MANERQLTSFVAVAELGSFNKAAEERALTPAALSLSIKQLEDEAGVKLFARSTRSVNLTNAGWAFLPKAQAALAALEAARLELVDISAGVSGRLRLAVSPSIGKYVVPQVLRNLLIDSPTARVEVKEGTAKQVFDWVERGQADFGLQGQLSEWPGIRQVFAMQDPFVEHGEGPRVGLTPDTGIERALESAGVAAPRLRATNPETALAMAEAMGWSVVLPRLALPRQGRQLDISRRLVWVLREKAELSPLAQLCVKQFCNAGWQAPN